MEIVLDTANVEEIKKYCSFYEITGVTTNPTILAREKKPFFPLFEEIKGIIGDKQLHVQVTGDTWEDMIKEAECIIEKIGKDTYVKVPSNEQGIKAMKELKKGGIRVTATAIYSTQQAMLAAVAGADYVAPYFNRMNNLNVDSKQVIADIAHLYELHNKDTKILAASFKNTQQIMDSLMAGAHAVTVSGELLSDMLTNPLIYGAVDGFHKDWTATYGDKRIYEL